MKPFNAIDSASEQVGNADRIGLGSTQSTRKSSRAFTILEIMIAMFIFSLVLTAIYSIWHGIIRGTSSGLKAAAEVQRSRVAMRTLEQALLSSRVFTKNLRYYYFVSNEEGAGASITMTCRLPTDFLGMGFTDPNLRMRRVSIFTRPDPEGKDELVLSHVPLLIDTNAIGGEPYSIVLARDVSRFELDFQDPRTFEWLSYWRYTNFMPKAVRVTLGLGKIGAGASAQSQDLVSRIIAMPAQNIAGLSGPAAGLPATNSFQ
jgi:prepilin-type N-terminal cleavage/methylation domain-containing protein